MRKYLSIFLVAIMIPMLFFTTTCLTSPEEYLIWYHEQYNEDGTSLLIVWLYRMTEAEPRYDFYIVKFKVIGMDSDPQGADDCSVEGLIFSNGVVNDWQPKAGLYFSPVSLSISVGGIAFGINIPAEEVETKEGLKPWFGWRVTTQLGSPDKEFVSSWYVPDGGDFAFLVRALEWSWDKQRYTDAINVYYPYVFGFTTLDVQEGDHGTTHPKPGTYTLYPAGFSASVWACPYPGYSLDYWEVEELVPPGGGGVGWYVDGSHNPLMLTMNDDYRVKAYFTDIVYLTMFAQDQSGDSLTTGDVYINGQLVGYTGSRFPVAEGTHMIFVNDFWEQEETGKRYSFQRWEDNSTNKNRNITITSGKTITANFTKKWCPGDVNGDGIVDIVDVVICASRCGIYRGLPEWTSIADLNCDGTIDFVDVVTVSLNFGKDYRNL